jgi:hypothetical protein
MHIYTVYFILSQSIYCASVGLDAVEDASIKKEVMGLVKKIVLLLEHMFCGLQKYCETNKDREAFLGISDV